MRQHGRKSAAKLALVQTNKDDTIAAPKYFNEDQRQLWHQIIASVGAAWFPPETLPILEQFVMLSVAVRKPDMTTTERVRCAGMLVKLASSMRISQYAEHEHEKKKRRQPRPIWQE
jgi:hypothetical protein